MKPIWYIIVVACVPISAIGRMADSLSKHRHTLYEVGDVAESRYDLED